MRILPAILMIYAVIYFYGTRPAHADSMPDHNMRSIYAPIGVVQVTPGIHVAISGGKFGVGASADLLSGVAFNGTGPVSRFHEWDTHWNSGPFHPRWDRHQSDGGWSLRFYARCGVSLVALAGSGIKSVRFKQ